MKSLVRNVLIPTVTVAALTSGVQSAQAVISTSGCVGVTFCTLSELLNGGSLFVDDPNTGGLIAINNFTTTIFPGGPTLPSFSNINVTASELIPGFNFSLAFDFGTGVTSTSANSQFGINYSISSINAAVTSAGIDGFTFGGTNVNNTASVTKTATEPGPTLSVVSVSSNGSGTNTTTLGPTTSLSIADVLFLDSGDGNPVSISGYNQIFGYEAASTPEPGTLLGLGLLGLGGLVSRKRKG